MGFGDTNFSYTLKIMASVFGHTITAFGLGKIFSKKVMNRKVFTLGIISSILQTG